MDVSVMGSAVGRETTQSSPECSNLEEPSRSPLLLLPNAYRAFYGSFPQLRSFQKEAMLPILEGRDLVVQSATGSGKTEAVLAPCMEQVIRSGKEDAVAYLVPTRALAVDLQRRLTPIVVDRLGLSMGIRTGDLKRMGGEKPDLMITTPESLDVLLGSSNAHLQGFVRRIRMVIIDEVHPLLQQYRGRQLAYLLRRLQCRTGRPVQKIALSATIADVEAILSFFHFSPDTVRILDGVQRSIVPHLVHLKGDDELVALLDDLHKNRGYRKILLFANSRGQCDRLFALLRSRGCFQQVAELHYSNLKAKERRAIENRFRRRAHALCIATSTLELGIDMGDVDGVVLHEPPDSVTAFLQRIGRSNRRGTHTHFWGICRGERAADQLLRFLGLLHMARQGIVEKPLTKDFPSVLIQQTLSCLYQGRRISLAGMQALFPQDGEDLARIFPAMEREGWLRRDRPTAAGTQVAASASGHADPESNGLFRGARRYGKDLMDLKIWSNFPESEEDYTLEVAGEAVADIPHSIVRQLELGDRVHLAGKPIQVIEIVDEGERKRVTANPVEHTDDKKIVWLGTGFQVPYEVARSIKGVLNGFDENARPTDFGLFRRTRRLFEEESLKRKRMVILANGIEVQRDKWGMYRYGTYLGSMGNLVLRVIVEQALDGIEDLSVRSDEATLTCSHWIDFQRLPLPENRDGFDRWVRENMQSLRFLLPLNAFAQGLPRELLVKEMRGFVYDERVARDFSRYRSKPSTILSGEPRWLEFAPESSQPAGLLLQPSACPPLLTLEKERRAAHEQQGMLPFPESASHVERAVTGTMVGDYMRHRQCARRLSSFFLPPELRELFPRGEDEDGREARFRRGREFEDRVVKGMEERGATVFTVSSRDDRGRLRTLDARFQETLDHLEAWAKRSSWESGSGSGFYLMQPVLKMGAVLKKHFQHDVFLLGEKNGENRHDTRDFSLLDRVEGVGIPDWVRVSKSPEKVVIEAGDIKDSSKPHYSQKWQVAFYAYLLGETIHSRAFSIPIEVSSTGTLITRRGRGHEGSVVHSFDLAPFMAAMPAMFHNMAETLVCRPFAGSWHLQEHCTTCPCFDHCHAQALAEETVQFVPGLTRGTLGKLRRLGLTSVEDAHTWLHGSGNDGRNGSGSNNSNGSNEGRNAGSDGNDKNDGNGSGGTAPEPIPPEKMNGDPLEPHERERLTARIEALVSNGIKLRRRKTRLFPSNISTAIFVHLTTDPAGDTPRTLGYLAVDEGGKTIAGSSRAISNPDEAPLVRKAFMDEVLAVWNKSFEGTKVPHLFHWGTQIHDVFEPWGESTGDAAPWSFLQAQNSPHKTDLLKLLRDHFDFPLPGKWTLHSLSAVLGILPPSTGQPGDAEVSHRQPLLQPPGPNNDNEVIVEAAIQIDASTNQPTPPQCPPSPPSPPSPQPSPQVPHHHHPGAGSPAQVFIPRQSLFHDDPSPHCSRDEWEVQEHLREQAVQETEWVLGLQCRILLWARSHLESDLEGTPPPDLPDEEKAALAYVHFLEEEKRLREQDILTLQEYGLEERVLRFRALGPLVFDGTCLDDEGRFLQRLRFLHGKGVSKFREDDFLKLAPVGAADLQAGHPVILTRHDPGEDFLCVLSRGGKPALNKRLTYSLEEDITDWNHEKLVNVVHAILENRREYREHPARALLQGRGAGSRSGEKRLWIENRLRTFEPFATLNPSQQRALELPFRRTPALIEGPPGTGKTHLLGWILIALVLEARENGSPLRIAVSALTHQAIDGVLRKVMELVRRHGMEHFPARLFKYGRWKEDSFRLTGGDVGSREMHASVEPLRNWEEAASLPYLILGATGFGLHGLFKGGTEASARVFDWIVFDEASQILTPQALLSLAHGKGKTLFLGDVKQLPPIVLGTRSSGGEEKGFPLEIPGKTMVVEADSSIEVQKSILERLLDLYGEEHRVRLHETYRMNEYICAFPSAMWYDGELRAAKGNARTVLDLHDRTQCGEYSKEDERLDCILDPRKPVVLVLTEHEGCRQTAEVEVETVARLAARLMTVYGVNPDRMGLISPHRAHNNATALRLRKLAGDREGTLPVMDTVERLQGAERDVIFFSLTTSDPDHTMSPFINNPNRFNVAVTRAKHKLVVVGSRAFFLQVPETAEGLEGNRCFKEFFQFCRERDALFILSASEFQ